MFYSRKAVSTAGNLILQVNELNLCQLQLKSH
jgi:hypothetical protein